MRGGQERRAGEEGREGKQSWGRSQGSRAGGQEGRKTTRQARRGKVYC